MFVNRICIGISNIYAMIAIDIDECQKSKGGCQHQCVNTIGSYYCECRLGYVGRNQSRQCFGKLINRILIRV